MEEMKNVKEKLEEEKEKLSSKDYKLIIDMMKEVDDQYNSVKKTLNIMVQNTYYLNPKVLDMILPYAKESLPLLSLEELKSFLLKYTIEGHEDFYNSKTKDEIFEIMNTIKDASLVLLSSKAEADEIKKSSNEVLKDYFNYMTSDKIRKSREQRLEAMKKALELEEDEVEKKKIQKMINTIESTLNFSFINTRFEKFGEKELKSIKDCFFDNTKGSYVINRYKDKIVSFGYKEEIFKYFYNIEENFLASKYSPFNNLFLFIYMRMVAYSNPDDKNDKMMVQALTGALASLVYHKFDDLESEQYFIQVITNILDKFTNNENFDYLEYFKNNNQTYENHPARKALVEAHEINRKKALIKSLMDLKINNFSETMTADELQDIYNRETELMIKNQIGNKEEENLEVSDIEDVKEVEADNEVENINEEIIEEK